MPKLIVPSFMQDVFTCPFCDVTAKQEWYGNSHAEHAYYGLSEYTLQESLKLDSRELIHVDGLDTWLFAKCTNCEELSVWHNNEMVYPEHCPVAEPNPDMPEAVEDKYREAAKVVSLSPVSAAALLRLALQLLLMDVLGDESTGNIYKDIDALKKSAIGFIAYYSVRHNSDYGKRIGSPGHHRSQREQRGCPVSIRSS